jgi:hypothetical protein
VSYGRSSRAYCRHSLEAECLRSEATRSQMAVQLFQDSWRMGTGGMTNHVGTVDLEIVVAALVEGKGTAGRSLVTSPSPSAAVNTAEAASYTAVVAVVAPSFNRLVEAIQRSLAAYSFTNSAGAKPNRPPETSTHAPVEDQVSSQIVAPPSRFRGVGLLLF